MSPFDDETTRVPLRPGGDAAPRPEEKPYLLGIKGEPEGRLFPLESLREVFIGRVADNEIMLPLDQDVSRRHARISLDDAGRAWIEDLGSTNGTLVEGVYVSGPRQLRRGDRIYIGESCILKMDWFTAEEVERWKSASFDMLTDCLNRASFDRRLEDLVTLARSRMRPLALIVLDADKFKAVNDDHGHQAGDYVLQHLAAVARGVLGELPGDVPIFRCGGEEFAVLLPDADVRQAASLAERMRAAIERASFEYQDVRLPVTVSAGVAGMTGKEDVSAETLYKGADEKLYRAKREGRNRVVS